MNTNNSTGCGALRHMFPVEPPTPVPTLHNDPGGIALQSNPLAVVALTWLFLESRGLKPSTRLAGGVASTVALLIVAVESVLVWHTFDLFECEGKIHVKQWSIVAVCGGVVSQSVLLFIIAFRFPRSAAFTFLLLGAGAIFADISLRGGFIISTGSHLLVAIQQCFSVLTLCCLYFIRHPQKTVSIVPRKRIRDVLSVPDALMQPSKTTQQDDQAVRWSWFAV